MAGSGFPRRGSDMAAIPDDVRRFILTSIPSVPFLEAALLLRARNVELTSDDVARALYVSEPGALDLLNALCAAGAVCVALGEPPRYRFAPRDERMAAAFGRLADAYAADLVGVAKLIHDSTHKNAQRFADAFRLRKDR
jgi:hypothetical protein